MARNYRREYQLYGGKPEQIKRRALRNAARRMLMKEGRVQKGDGKDVDHIRRSRKGALDNARSNLRVVPASVNRSRK